MATNTFQKINVTIIMCPTGKVSDINRPFSPKVPHFSVLVKSAGGNLWNIARNAGKFVPGVWKNVEK